MRLKEIKTIDVFTRWWYDEENGNPYYARKIVVNIGTESEKTFTVRMTWGTIYGIESDHIERLLKLPKSVSFTNHTIFRQINYRSCEVKAIRYTYHPEKRIYKEEGLRNPERFRNF